MRTMTGFRSSSALNRPSHDHMEGQPAYYTPIPFDKPPRQFKICAALIRNASDGTGLNQCDYAMVRASNQGRAHPHANHSPCTEGDIILLMYVLCIIIMLLLLC